MTSLVLKGAVTPGTPFFCLFSFFFISLKLHAAPDEEHEGGQVGLPRRCAHQPANT
jgi:hypothetical protein